MRVKFWTVSSQQITDVNDASRRKIETARKYDRPSPENFWFKQLFSIGVNEVMQMLERMSPIHHYRLKCILLDFSVILVASDCHPRLLTKKLESLANSKNVPVVFVKDNKRGSLRLGELIKLKTAIAIGVKDKRNQFNQFISGKYSTALNEYIATDAP
ncbi:hypothetical protein P3S68_031445 [Capsicum galapagoense]